ncbi:MAG: GNAT family N-acetyltransferase [Chloroflexi bacterium]|nr:MAG: GNAT family N-acetyltransferase [Chloroflexota bacterium]
MPEIEIRPANAADIPILVELEHDYTSDYVWQMDIVNEEKLIDVRFKQIKLPRSVRVEYPRSPKELEKLWTERDAVLTAVHEGVPVGYLCVSNHVAPITNWVTDLVVTRRMRRQGVGTALILASQEWARQFNNYRLILEMQPKNYPAISLAQKLGFDFCGYNDRYYANRDIALFFVRSVR